MYIYLAIYKLIFKISDDFFFFRGSYKDVDVLCHRKSDITDKNMIDVTCYNSTCIYARLFIAEPSDIWTVSKRITRSMHLLLRREFCQTIIILDL